jgi:hypothetical protein
MPVGVQSTERSVGIIVGGAPTSLENYNFHDIKNSEAFLN